MRVAHSVGRGYFLTLPATSLSSSLPPVFIQSTIFKKTLQCSTEEIASLSRATDESAAQCVLLTCQVLRDRLLATVRAQMDALLKVRRVGRREGRSVVYIFTHTRHQTLRPIHRLWRPSPSSTC